MADLFLDPRLDDYFVEHDWQRIEADDAAARGVVDDFLAQKISVIRNLGTSEIDFAFLETVRLPQTWQFKKFQFRDFLGAMAEGRDTAETQALLERSFGGDRARLEMFAAQLRLVRGIAERVLDRVLGHLVTGETIMVARFSETRMENLHYDLDRGSDDHEAFRFYINLDAYPRIWSTSYQMAQLLERGGQRLLAGIDPDQPAETILKRATTRAYGGWHHRATERMAPRHHVYFDPGDVWIVDGRSVSHQVTSGHRVLSVYVRIPHAPNPDLAPTFAGKLHASFTAGMEKAAGEETALVNYYSSGAITGAANLRDEWEEVFGDTRTGRIRRFDAKGMMPLA
jgi:hypothetical protein